MILHRDCISVESPYHRLRESVFWKLELKKASTDGMVLPLITLCDAFGCDQCVIMMETVPFHEVCIELVRIFRIPIKQQPGYVGQTGQHIPWSFRTSGDQALIWLHGYYDCIRGPRRDRVTFYDFLLTLLAHVSALHLGLSIVGEDVQATLYFGLVDPADPEMECAESKRKVITSRGHPRGQCNLLEEALFPLSETSDT